MPAFGTGVNPSLGKVDYSGQQQGALMGAQVRGNALNQLIDTAGKTMQDYRKKQEEKQILNYASSNIAAALAQSPTFQKKLGINGTDPKEISLWLKAVGGGDALAGATTGMKIISSLKAEEQSSQAVDRMLKTGDISGVPPEAVKQYLDMMKAGSEMANTNAQTGLYNAQARASGIPKMENLTEKEALVADEIKAFTDENKRPPTARESADIRAKVLAGSGAKPAMPPGYEPDPGNPGAIRPIQGSPDWVAQQDKARKFDLSVQDAKIKANNVLSVANSVLPKIDVWTAGLAGQALSKLPGTAAADLKRQIETIEANVAFDRLQEMRASSPTGGALGNVSNVELDLLRASLRSLNQSQTPAQLKENLNAVVSHYNRFLMTMEGKNPNDAQAPAQAQPAKRLRYNPETGSFE